MVIKINENTKVKLWMRVCFALMSVFFITSYFSDSIAFGYFTVLAAIPTFILAIYHICLYKEKTLAITAIVFSSIFILLFSIGFVVGVASTVA